MHVASPRTRKDTCVPPTTAQKIRLSPSVKITLVTQNLISGLTLSLDIDLLAGLDHGSMLPAAALVVGTLFEMQNASTYSQQNFFFLHFPVGRVLR